MKFKILWGGALALALLTPSGIAVAIGFDQISPDMPSGQLAKSHTIIVTLGTAGGPPPRADRSQPANALIVNGTPYLIDAGENVVRQIERAGLDYRRVGRIFLTHNHSDHTLGLPALIATQWEAQRRDPVQIFGPVGTQRLVKGMLDFLAVNSEIRRTEGHPSSIDNMVAYTEVVPGLIYRDANVSVRAVENNHFHFPARTGMGARHKSYAYRFDTADRSVVFTGDTGPSSNVTELAKGADVLVSEVSVAGEVLELFKRTGRWDNKTPQEQRDWLRHQTDEHLSPETVAALASAAGLKEVILTHLTPTGIAGDDYARWAAIVRKGFKGKVTVASDLERF